MSLTFGSFSIPGSFTRVYAPWGLQLQFNEVFGAQGQTVLAGERTKREITFEAWLYNTDAGWAESDLGSFLEDLADQQGNVATLEEANAALDDSWQNVLFVGFEQERGPFPPGGTITNSWWIAGKLHFVQLQP